MKIGILGLPLQSDNKGCEALTLSFLEVLNQIGIEKNIFFDVYVFRKFPILTVIRKRGSLERIGNSNNNTNNYFSRFDKIKIYTIFYRQLFKNMFYMEKSVNELDYVFDFTAGDSFTDLYGKKRFFERSYLKNSIIKNNVPLVLGSQTIGPFNDYKVKNFAVSIINNCHKVFVRDSISYDYVVSISERKPVLTTDIAFFLPYTKQELRGRKIKIGVNPSGLLWSGGYSGDNQFKLSIDYKEYTFRIINQLLLDEAYEVHLIPHAISKKMDFPDNDLIAINEIATKYKGFVSCAPFESAIDAKSYISGMDLFIGARMHATIAAFSSGVPVIPVSYSRKFEGLYNSLDYPYVISATRLSTEEAVSKTLEWIEQKETLRSAADNSLIKVKELSDYLMEQVKHAINV